MYINQKSGVVAVGYAGKDALFENIGNKKTAILKFSIAVGKRGNETLWFDCYAWNPIASRFRDAIKKGDSIMVMGTWVKSGYNGGETTRLECQFVQLLGDMRKQEKEPDDLNAPYAIENVYIGGSEDELPF